MANNLKENTEYCYSHKIGNKTHCTYSNKTIDLIIREIKNNPTDIIAHLKNSTKKKVNPRSKGILGITPTPIREPSFIHHKLTFV